MWGGGVSKIKRKQIIFNPLGGVGTERREKLDSVSHWLEA